MAEDEGIEAVDGVEGGAAYDEIAFEIRGGEAGVFAEVVVWWGGGCRLVG